MRTIGENALKGLITKTRWWSWISICFIAESKLSNQEQTEADNEESSEDSDTSDCLEKHVHEFFYELRNYDMTTWDMETVHKLMSNLAELSIKEFDEFNIALR